MGHKLLRLDEVMELTGSCRSTIYNWMSKGEFPPNKQLGGRTVAWLESDIIDWINGRKVYQAKPARVLLAKASYSSKN